ncbi:hypothetical protein ABMA27_010821 [Loxostege sticticalis]|uniref:Retrovirus-related Pol polyprotein from type-1 retrotransposable element R1 n=1 Tax=Loxostege sticticalis TaxID=481309 RepID=A0ABR3H2Q2_LOXSC
MATTRTPAKKAMESRNPPISPEIIIIDERAGSSQTTPPEPSRVRRSIGEWESAMVEPRPCSSTAHAHSPTKTAPAPAAQLRPKTKAMTNVESKTAARRASTEASVVSPGPRPETAKPTDRVTQARRLLAKAKSHVSESRNLRSDLKTGITQALDGLFALVKEMAAAATAPEKEIDINKKAERSTLEQGSLGLEGNELLRMMKEQGEKIDKTQREMEKLKETIVLQHEAARQQLTYAAAAAAAAPPVKPTVERKSALHSIMIESKDELETGDEVMRQVREAVNAKDGWVTVERVKKVKDKKVILGCRTIEEREKVKERLQSAANRLSFEDMKNQDPMVILRDVIASHSENDILMALRNQNGGVFQGLEAKDSRMEVRAKSSLCQRHQNVATAWLRNSTAQSTTHLALSAQCGGSGRRWHGLRCSTGAKVVPVRSGAGAPTRRYAVAQANLQRKQLATTELMADASRRKVAFALVQEPYVGGVKRMKDYRGARVFQNTEVGDGTVKAAIVVFDGDLDVLQCPKLTNDNIVVVRIRTSAWEIAAVSFYFEPDKPIGPHLERLREVIEELGPTKLLIGGDSNAKSTWWGSKKEDHRGEEMSGTLEESGLQVLNIGDTPTFETIRGGKPYSSRVDLTACSEDLLDLVDDWRVDREITCSDHNTITFDISLRRAKGLTVQRTTRLYNTKKAAWDLFNTTLAEAKTHSGINVANINNITEKNQLELLLRNYTEAITKACKTSMPAKKSTEVLRIPWWNEELDRLKKVATTARRKIRNAAPYRRDLVVTEYLEKKDLYESQAKKAQIESWKQFCEKQDREGLWEGIYRVIGRTTKRTEDMPLVKDGTHLNPEESANLLAETFYPKDLEETDSDHHRRIREAAKMVNEHKHDEQHDPPFTMTELRTAMGSFNPKKAPGADGFTSEICSRAVNQDLDAFLALFNKCLSIGYFPNIWKEATVVVLRKPGKDDYTNPKAYRPIGLLPVLGKVLEKMTVARMKWHLVPRISTRQYGFMPQKSTEDALYTLIHRIKGKIELKKLVTLVSLDIEGAFDSAWWPAIRVRLAEEKCPVNIRRLLDSYLERRRVKVRFAGEEVGRDTNKGCVQGSIGGPILWNLLLDPLLRGLEDKGHYVQAFADDVVLVFDGDTSSQVTREANAALEFVRQWGHKNKLKFAAHKTCAMVLTRKLKYDNPRLTMGGVHIAISREIKVLGLIIDDKLTFNSHILTQTKKALEFYKQLSRAAKVNWGLHPEVIRLIYTACVEPVIMYAAAAWAPTAEKIGVQKLLNAVQRGFAQKLCKSYRTVSLHSALTLAGILPLDLRIQEAAALYETKRGSPLPELGDRETESMVRFAETPHPATHMAIGFERLEDQSLVDRHNVQAVRIFTDGSKIEGKVGAALSLWKGETEIRNQKFCLSAYCTVYQAELLAICKATGVILKGREKSYGLYSDSMAALETIVNHGSLHPLAVETRENLRKAFIQGKDVSLFWIKAHAGLLGNERADDLAKEAALTSKRKPDYDRCPVSFAKRTIRARSIVKWADRYKTGNTASTTKTFFPDASAAYKIVRQIKPAGPIVQILTGHGGFSHYLHRFKCKDSPSCTCDPTIDQTVTHLLTSCPIYARQRYDFEQITGAKIASNNLHELVANKEIRNKFISYCENICVLVNNTNKT